MIIIVARSKRNELMVSHVNLDGLVPRPTALRNPLLMAQAQEVHQAIRSWMSEKVSTTVAEVRSLTHWLLV